MKEHYDPRVLDAFILTFKDNSEPVIVTQQGDDNRYRVVPAQWLYDMTNGRACFIQKDHRGGIEIAIPIATFLDLKDNRNFQGRCTTLVRLRTGPKTVLGKLCYPIGHIDNKIE